MNPYRVQEVDARGQVLLEKEVVADSYNAVLRRLDNVSDAATRIKVLNPEGEDAGEINVAYWKKTVRRK